MVRGLLEKALSPQILDDLFERNAKTQYTRELCMPWQAIDDFRFVGQSDSGMVFEQNIILSADDGQLLKIRRVKVCLEQPNRDGDREIFILTNLPFEVANALLIAQLYRKRWKLETLFGEMV